MVATLISQFITILMLVSIYNCIMSISRKEKKKAVLWGIAFIVPVIFLIILLLIFSK